MSQDNIDVVAFELLGTAVADVAKSHIQVDVLLETTLKLYPKS